MAPALFFPSTREKTKNEEKDLRLHQPHHLSRREAYFQRYRVGSPQILYSNIFTPLFNSSGEPSYLNQTINFFQFLNF